MPGRNRNTNRRKRGVKPTTLNYVIDIEAPVLGGIMDSASFEKFLNSKIKVNGGRAGVLGDKVEITRDKQKIYVKAKAPFSKRYLKYLTKKYLKSEDIRDYLRVVATDRDTYEVRYFQIEDDSDDEDEEEYED
eukprot:TRINITY_DN136650_c0_g1_i1.p1 TRINITY_DN136650_c0_g1~~TRINITY_DN136650_c0_g1_i1.p1  ORF type:complete len:133 (-),score=40.68 TRINITY_DN136650_c0_g1_i1:127-525(-)